MSMCCMSLPQSTPSLHLLPLTLSSLPPTPFPQFQCVTAPVHTPPPTLSSIFVGPGPSQQAGLPAGAVTVTTPGSGAYRSENTASGNFMTHTGQEARADFSCNAPFAMHRLHSRLSGVRVVRCPGCRRADMLPAYAGLLVVCMSPSVQADRSPNLAIKGRGMFHRHCRVVHIQNIACSRRHATGLCHACAVARSCLMLLAGRAC